MKVCLFADATSIHTRRIATGWRSRGLDVHVVTHKPATVPGVSVERFRVPPPGLASPFRWTTRRRRYLRDFARAFDIVSIQFLQDWGFTVDHLADACFVVTPWGSDLVRAPDENAPSSELVEHRRMLLRQATAVTAWGDSFARTVAQYADLDVGSIHRVPLGVDLDLFHPDRRGNSSRSSPDSGHPTRVTRHPITMSGLLEPAPARRTPHVGFFKGFRAVYGPTHLVEAIPRILEHSPRARFTMIGDGPQLEPCRAMAQHLGVHGSINWLPPQPHDRIPAHLASWDLTVIPSVCESFGAAALEASAMRVPVVASRVGGLVDTVRHGITGWHTPPEDAPALAEAVVRLLNDPDLRRRMGASGRRFVEEQYDWARCLDTWLEVFSHALDRRCSPA